MNGDAPNAESHFAEEKIDYDRDEDRPNRFVPEIFITKKSGVTSTRKFEATDMARVLEFEEVSGGRAPTFRDGSCMVGDFLGDGTSGITFPVFHIALRGGHIFCFNEADVEPGRSGSYTTYEAPPVCIIPLDNVDVQFPPGGRRVFREHAQTAAQSGYELIIQHSPTSDEDPPRPPAFLVADSLSKRNKLGEAIKARSKVNKPTVLRAGYSAAVAAAGAASEDPMSQAHRNDLKKEKEARNGGDNNKMMNSKEDRNGTSRRKGDSKSMEKKILEVSDDADMAAAVVEYGVNGFEEKDWATNYFQGSTHADAVVKCEQMEKWLTNMKKSLKGAVLEQYEYFVQASGEMTTMGKEVSSLKAKIESQVDTLRDMKDIDFVGATREDDLTEGDELMGKDDDGSASLDSDKDDNIFGEDFGALMNRHRGNDMNGHGNTGNDQSMVNDKDAPPQIEVPEWLDDADEEILATMRECRYSSAIDQYLKAEAEILELLDKHEQPTPYELSPGNLDKLRAQKKRLKSIGNKICSHLEESLRRKNEALRQANKRERADASASLAPVVSPCALNDDGHYLQMLVKLGRTKEAAEAFTARRSLLLLECLQERPMSGAGTVDLVIYAAQLSQSFFSCLASSVEGFLDLFIVAPHDKAEDSDASSLQSHSMVGNKTLPAGAVSSLVLWCDAELSKFAIAFGGTRILANLALSPPSNNSSAPRVVGETKDRDNAIAVAAQCIDQGFLYAAQNLDGVGLPLSPRLAEMIRVRLKGCEAEIAERLHQRWQTLTQDWRQQHY